MPAGQYADALRRLADHQVLDAAQDVVAAAEAEYLEVLRRNAAALLGAALETHKAAGELLEAAKDQGRARYFDSAAELCERTRLDVDLALAECHRTATLVEERLQSLAYAVVERPRRRRVELTSLKMTAIAACAAPRASIPPETAPEGT